MVVWCIIRLISKKVQLHNLVFMMINNIGLILWWENLLCEIEIKKKEKIISSQINTLNRYLFNLFILHEIYLLFISIFP